MKPATRELIKEARLKLFDALVTLDKNNFVENEYINKVIKDIEELLGYFN